MKLRSSQTIFPSRVLLVLGIVTLLASTASASEKEDEKPKWDVNNPPGSSSDVAIDVNEGTWMSVDVHPNGKELVFDLLGDLYLLPLAGGEAVPIRTGRAWDMQPRFSPNGKWIAFTSDREGGDNIWVMDRDGSNPRALTKETFRLLNSPTWSPDSRFIAARKHFTSGRSLGAGEIWLYHHEGGGGLQMTKKPNDQKDLGEPAFSPDGKYLYYSQDTTPGSTFEYDKDANTGIYSIQRLTLSDGKVESWIDGPGGAIRPTPSPDKEHIAFIRRIRGKSVLMVQEAQSQKEWIVYDQMDRDLQETWAIHGVYPGISWTPNGMELVFWAGGKLRRANIRTREILEIPFHVSDHRTVAEPLRFQVNVHPPKVPAKMMRWATISPDGKKLVFQALGSLYVQNYPKGNPKKLTRDRNIFEFYPSWSRDSQSVVYTTWNDNTLGSVRMISADGGKSRKLTREPGHYVEPSFSPDGRSAVYRKTKGAHLVSSMWSRNTGIYQVSTSGGKGKRIATDGKDPHFGRSNEELFRTLKGKDGPKLVVLNLSGHTEHTCFTTKHAVYIRVSPDSQWVAFSENYQAFVTPFVRTGKPVSLGPKMTNLPVSRITERSATYLHWSGDSKRLAWSEGPDLFTKELHDAFSFLSSDATEEKQSEPYRISLQIVSDIPTGIIAFVGAHVLTMDGEKTFADGTVVVEDNRIVAIGPRTEIPVPNKAFVVDAKGMTLMPGLVDVHAHSAQGWNGMTPQQNWENLALLAFGVTTTHDPSNNTATVFAAAEMALAGRILAPRIFSTGTILYGATASITAKIDSLQDAKAHVDRLKSVGASSVKSYNQPRRDQRQQVIEAGRQAEMMVVPEGGALFHHNMTQIVDGHTGIEHALPIGKMYSDVLQLWSATPVGYTPTLGVAYGGLSGIRYWLQESDVWDHPRLSRFVPQNALDPGTRRAIKAPMNEWNHVLAAEGARDLVRAGGKAQMGAHGEREGLAAHWEIWMLTQGGLTPFEALRAATIDGAFYLGMDQDIGSIEVGKLADMILIEGNPLEDIRATERVKYTLLNGRLYEAETLHQIGNHPEKRVPLFFER